MNKPVGYFTKASGIWWEVDENDREDTDIPLYTHPVKELTDEEIIAEAQGVKYSELSIGVNDFYILFAKAILRKAQKK